MKVEAQVSSTGTIAKRARAIAEQRPLAVTVFLPLFVIYLATASVTSHTHIDSLTNAITGWYLGMTGSVVTTEHVEAATDEQRGNVAWIVESPRGPVSQYPPGAAALSAPVYWIAGQPMTDWYVWGYNRPEADAIPFPLPSPFPAALTASLVAATAMAFIAASVPLAGGTRAQGVAVAYVGGLATTMWATASDSLWQHGPAAMWLALGIYLAAKGRFIGSGLAFGAAVLTRPPVALIAAAVGLAVGISRRKLRPTVEVGIGSAVGLLGLLLFNHWVWGEPSITGGYGDVFVDNVTAADADGFLANVAGGLIDPGHGLLPYAPFLILLVPGLAGAWRKSPDWAKGAAVGGVVYLLVQWKANRFSGGEGFLGYRYPLEFLTAGAILFYAAYHSWVRERPMATRLFWFAVVVAVIPQVYWSFWIDA